LKELQIEDSFLEVDKLLEKDRHQEVDMSPREGKILEVDMLQVEDRLLEEVHLQEDRMVEESSRHSEMVQVSFHRLESDSCCQLSLWNTTEVAGSASAHLMYFYFDPF